MKFKNIIFLFFLFINFFIKPAELEFINNTQETVFVRLVDWKRAYGLIYRQEEPRLAIFLQTINWYPFIKPNIQQKVLEIYDKNKKLVYKLDIKPYNGLTVPAGFTRTIIYSGPDMYQDIVAQSGRKVSHFARVSADFLEKSREFIIESTYNLFGIQRKIIRNTRSINNSEIYNIIHGDKYIKQNAQVRVGGSFASKQEKDVFYERQKIVKKAQEEFLGVKLNKDEKPLVIAFVASGGGERARLYTAGSLAGAEKIGLLGCGTYLATLSGSTWFAAPWMLSGLSLQDYLNRVVSEAKYDLGFDSRDIIGENKRLLEQLKIKFAFAQPIGFTDVYGALLASRYLSGLGQDGNSNRCYISSLAENKKMNIGESLIPIFAAVTAEVALGHVWCEFTPWEFGSRWFGQSGAYIPVWAFGRNFESLNSNKNWGTNTFGSKDNPLYEPMQTLGFLLGIWGSAPAATIGQAYDQIINNMSGSAVKTVLELVMKKTDLKKVRFLWTDINNFMYNSSVSIFSKYKYLKLADAGVKFINPIFSTYRRPAQGKNIKDGSAPDVIIIWDSGASESGFSELKAQANYAKKHNHPFPAIDLAVSDRQIINVFDQNPDPTKYKNYEIPTVIYMKKGIDKNLLEKYSQDPVFKDMVVGLKNFDLNACMKNVCETFNFKYDAKQNGVLVSQLLIDMAKFNTMVSVSAIKEALIERLALNRVRDGVQIIAAHEAKK